MKITSRGHSFDIWGWSEKNVPDKGKVFLIHGRNDFLRKSMFEFLRSVGIKPVEWVEAIELTGKASPYIGDILNAAFSSAQAIVALLTPDDEARLLPQLVRNHDPDFEKNLTPQARPNVIFETGMAFGMNQDRTIIVEVGNLRPFSDIAGRHVIRLDDTPERRFELIARLRMAGCHMNVDGTDWLTTGSFSLATDNTKL